MFSHDPLDLPQLSRAEAKITRQRNRIQPELSRQPIPINVDVRRSFGSWL
jgi:hypothetical protein